MLVTREREESPSLLLVPTVLLCVRGILQHEKAWAVAEGQYTQIYFTRLAFPPQVSPYPVGRCCLILAYSYCFVSPSSTIGFTTPDRRKDSTVRGPLHPGVSVGTRGGRRACTSFNHHGHHGFRVRLLLSPGYLSGACRCCYYFVGGRTTIYRRLDLLRAILRCFKAVKTCRAVVINANIVPAHIPGPRPPG